MAFPRRQSGIQMEVIVSLLILLGMILGECEGIQCYMQNGAHASKFPVNCSSATPFNSCVTIYNFGAVQYRLCDTSPDKQCMEETFGAGRPCVKQTTEELIKFNKCFKARTTADLQKGRESTTDGALYNCYCYADLCNDDNNDPGTGGGGSGNPADRSTPNAKVILIILVAGGIGTFITAD